MELLLHIFYRFQVAFGDRPFGDLRRALRGVSHRAHMADQGPTHTRRGQTKRALACDSLACRVRGADPLVRCSGAVRHDHVEPTIAAVAWLFELGKPVYHSLDSAERYSQILRAVGVHLSRLVSGGLRAGPCGVESGWSERRPDCAGTRVQTGAVSGDEARRRRADGSLRPALPRLPKRGVLAPPGSVSAALQRRESPRGQRAPAMGRDSRRRTVRERDVEPQGHRSGCTRCRRSACSPRSSAWDRAPWRRR